MFKLAGMGLNILACPADIPTIQSPHPRITSHLQSIQHISTSHTEPLFDAQNSQENTSAFLSGLIITSPLSYYVLSPQHPPVLNLNLSKMPRHCPSWPLRARGFYTHRPGFSLRCLLSPLNCPVSSFRSRNGLEEAP